MTITLLPDQESLIKAHVARGEFDSVEQAARKLIDEALAERAFEESDLDWVKPYVEEAQAEFARGEVLSLEDIQSQAAATLAAFKR